MMKKYEKNRDKARDAFEAQRFDSSNPRESLNNLHQKALNRFDVEIEWYDIHASRRRHGSAVIRAVATGLAGMSAVLLSMAAFMPAGLIKPDVAVGVLPFSTWATVLAVIAGVVLMIDRVFQVTTRYTRWRVMEYKLRIARTQLYVQFLKTFGSQPDDEITKAVFCEAQVLASGAYENLMKEIGEETKLWQEGVEKGMAFLQERLKSISEEAHTAVKADLKILADGRDVQQRKQAQQELEKEPVVLNVTIEKPVDAPQTLSVQVENVKEKKEEYPKHDVPSGLVLPIPLLPGLYILRLFDDSGIQLAVKSKRIDVGKDAEIMFKL